MSGRDGRSPSRMAPRLGIYEGALAREPAVGVSEGILEPLFLELGLWAAPLRDVDLEKRSMFKC
jgi:hypothetical protein